MARKHTSLTSLPLPWLGTVLCLLAILLGPAQIIPALLAAGAAMEGSHMVRVGSDGTELRLVLSHERRSADHPDFNPRHHPDHAAHRHGLAARILCLMTDRSATESDHVASFAIGPAWEESRSGSVSSLNPPHGDPPQAPGDPIGSPSFTPSRFTDSIAAGPPPDFTLAVLLLTTLLLI